MYLINNKLMAILKIAAKKEVFAISPDFFKAIYIDPTKDATTLKITDIIKIGI